jgi:TolB-like protein/DNA-binding winged helix-turn-helix (wHTH) protein
VPTPPQSESNEHSPPLRFGVFELDRHDRELRRDGRKVRLQEQPFQVLAYLLERAGKVVTREELRARLWPSSVFVDFDHGLNNAIARLREALADTAATPQFIETLPRLGYRFIHRVASEPVATGTSIPVASTARRPTRTTLAVAAALAAAVIIVGSLFGWRLLQGPVVEPQEQLSPRKAPSIAVLPFVDMSSDSDSEHFAAGLSAELLNKLTAIRGLKVIGQTSSFYFKGKQEPLSAIAKKLNVNHVLEGSVQRFGASLRITAQLVDATDGSHLWSQSFDRSFSDIFQIQEDIATAVAAALQLQLLDTDEQRLRRRGTSDAEAYRLYVMANAYLTGISVKHDEDTAKQLYERAIARDPRFAAAFAGLAGYYFRRAWTSMVNDPDELRLGLTAAERALELDPASSVALQARANYSMWRYRFLGDFAAYTQASGDYRRAIQLDPANYNALFDYGRALIWHEPSLAQSLFERVAELEPLAIPARAMGAVSLDIRGLHAAARQRLQELDDGILCCRGRYAVFLAGERSQFGQLDEAVMGLREAQERGGLEMPVWLWALYMSLNDRAAAGTSPDFGNTEVARTLSGAAALTMLGRYNDALQAIDRYRNKFGQSRLLDLPAARLALIAGKPSEALTILQQRMPDVYSGIEPINGHNAIPALDLAAARKGAGELTKSRQLLARIAAFLGSPAAPQLPLFIYQRARAHALAGESELALTTLDQAYAAGFRTLWAPDLHPQPLLYIDPIDADPGFAALRSQPRYRMWLGRVKADNARQLAQLRARDATQTTRRLTKQ